MLRFIPILAQRLLAMRHYHVLQKYKNHIFLRLENMLYAQSPMNITTRKARFDENNWCLHTWNAEEIIIYFEYIWIFIKIRIRSNSWLVNHNSNNYKLNFQILLKMFKHHFKSDEITRNCAFNFLPQSFI